jgi:hypothetical protein
MGTQDLLVRLFKGYKGLFKGYKAVSENPFTQYIRWKKDSYEEGVVLLIKKALMELVFNKYRILLKKGEWNAPTAEEEKILALQVETPTSDQEGGYR